MADAIETRTCRKCGEAKSLAAFRLRRVHGHYICRRACIACENEARKVRYWANHDAYRERLARYRASWRSRASFEARHCETCGKEFGFYKPLGNLTAAGRFCSVACRNAAGREDVRCAKCGTTFSTWRSVPRKYCSQACAGTQAEPGSFRCKHCGVVVDWLIPSIAAKRQFCSAACQYAAARKNATVKTNLYNGAEWAEIREAVIRRDGGVCGRCGTEADLIVHHIVRWRLGHDNSMANLTTLCRTCHALQHAADIPAGKLRPVVERQL